MGDRHNYEVIPAQSWYHVPRFTIDPVDPIVIVDPELPIAIADAVNPIWIVDPVEIIDPKPTMVKIGPESNRACKLGVDTYFYNIEATCEMPDFSELTPVAY